MTTLEVIGLTVLGTLSVVFGVLAVRFIWNLGVMIRNMHYSLAHIEGYLEEITTDDAPPKDGKAMYRSIDGKYEADSLDGLVEKMMTDPENKNLDKTKLDDFLKDIRGSDDDDENSEPWKKKK